VVAVAEAAGDAAVEFDESVDRFGAAVVRAAGVEVGEERRAPLLEGLAESLDLRDRTGREGDEDLLGDPCCDDARPREPVRTRTRPRPAARPVNRT
jgi:hypothetical protein